MRAIPEDRSTLETTAYHEVGHAVMAHLCGQIVTQVEIVGDEDHLGTTSCLRFLGEPVWGSDESVPSASYEARILCLVAGVAAEAVLTGDRSWREPQGDLDEAVQLALRIVGSCERVLPLLEQARDHAIDLLVRHWDAVEDLAQILLREKVLAGDVVRDRLQTSIDGKSIEPRWDRVA